MAYCTTIMTACSGSNQQYDAMENCMGACATYTIGTAADTGGNTLGCRLYHAHNALTDPVTHCIHAGPSGGGVCGNPCDGFCSIVDSVCPAQYPTGACTTLCPTYAATPTYTDPATGNTLSCRIYHATNAAAGSAAAAIHCAHAGSDGGMVCI